MLNVWYYIPLQHTCVGPFYSPLPPILLLVLLVLPIVLIVLLVAHPLLIRWGKSLCLWLRSEVLGLWGY